MIPKNYNTVPVLLGGFLFAFASRCIPTFFSLFLADKGYSTRDVILVSTLFFIGGLCASANIFKNKISSISSKVFQIAAATGSILLHLQVHIYLIAGWFTIRFIQGFIDVICRNSLNDLVHDRYTLVLSFFMNIGSSVGFLLMCFPEMYNLLFTITGVLLSLSLIAITFQKDNKEHHKLTAHKKDKAWHNWYSILKTNSTLFFGIILTTLLTTTLTTILPMTLRNNGFVNSDILRIMFIGSLGNAILQLAGSFFRNMLGVNYFFRILLLCLPLLYFGLMISIYYQSIITIVFIFFIFGLHNVINGTVVSIFREEEGTSYRLTYVGITQINNIGAILSSTISLIFLTFSPNYGVFILWFLSIFLIWLVIKEFKSSKKTHILQSKT